MTGMGYGCVCVCVCARACVCDFFLALLHPSGSLTRLLALPTRLNISEPYKEKTKLYRTPQPRLLLPRAFPKNTIIAFPRKPRRKLMCQQVNIDCVTLCHKNMNSRVVQVPTCFLIFPLNTYFPLHSNNLVMHNKLWRCLAYVHHVSNSFNTTLLRFLKVLLRDLANKTFLVKGTQ